MEGKLVLWNVLLFSLCSSCHDIQFLSSSPCFPGAERILQLIGPVWERQITINSGSSGVSRGAALVAFCRKEFFLCSCSELKVRSFKIDLQWLYSKFFCLFNFFNKSAYFRKAALHWSKLICRMLHIFIFQVNYVVFLTFYSKNPEKNT